MVIRLEIYEGSIERHDFTDPGGLKNFHKSTRLFFNKKPVERMQPVVDLILKGSISSTNYSLDLDIFGKQGDKLDKRSFLDLPLPSDGANREIMGKIKGILAQYFSSGNLLYEKAFFQVRKREFFYGKIKRETLITKKNLCFQDQALQVTKVEQKRQIEEVSEWPFELEELIYKVEVFSPLGKSITLGFGKESKGSIWKFVKERITSFLQGEGEGDYSMIITQVTEKLEFV